MKRPFTNKNSTVASVLFFYQTYREMSIITFMPQGAAAVPSRILSDTTCRCVWLNGVNTVGGVKIEPYHDMKQWKEGKVQSQPASRELCSHASSPSSALKSCNESRRIPTRTKVDVVVFIFQGSCFQVTGVASHLLSNAFYIISRLFFLRLKFR